MLRITDTVKHLIIINVLFFVATQALGNVLFDTLAIWYPENTNFRIWQVFTHMFMHHQTFYLHILMNMLGLWMFGSPLEQMWDRKKFLFFYFSAGLGAVFIPWIIDYYNFHSGLNLLIQAGIPEQSIVDLLNEGRYAPAWAEIIGQSKLNSFAQAFTKSSVGASGALMGLIAAFGINFPNAKMALIFLPVPIAAKYFIPILLTYEILSGIFGWSSIFGVNIAHFAHVGGALVGGIIAWYWKKNQFKRWG